jgi:hypothetical protein
MIHKVGGKYVLYSKDGKKRLSKPTSKKDVKKREKQVQYFKYLDKSIQENEMTNPQEGYEDMMTSFSAIMDAQPADRERFLKSIHNTPMEDQFKHVMNVYEQAGKQPEITKSFRDAYEKLTQK